jgi:biopolymer transport protein ExbD
MNNFMKLRRKKRLEGIVELNITAFMDLMVSLVCFLLITAVFSRMSVVELNLPQLNAKANPNEEIKLSLQLVIHANTFDIRDANLGLIKQIERNPQKTDWKIFDKTLLEIKYRFPNEQNISLLLEPGISYKTMIEVMDHVRTTNVINAGTVEEVELFPNISIGDAPDAVAPAPDATSLTEPEAQSSAGVTQ